MVLPFARVRSLENPSGFFSTLIHMPGPSRVPDPLTENEGWTCQRPTRRPATVIENS
jgi:hypothetical protein